VIERLRRDDVPDRIDDRDENLRLPSRDCVVAAEIAARGSFPAAEGTNENDCSGSVFSLLLFLSRKLSPVHLSEFGPPPLSAWDQNSFWVRFELRRKTGSALGYTREANRVTPAHTGQQFP